MAFKKYIKISFLLTIIGICSHIIYDKYIKNNFEITIINIDNFCNRVKSSSYIFKLPTRDVVIKDDNGLIKKIYVNKNIFNKDFLLDCKKNKKYFFFKQGAILKTQNDSIDVMKFNEKLHGYMGIWQKNNCYYVDYNGNFKNCIKDRVKGKRGQVMH